MNESIVKSLMRLFALVADVNKYGYSGNEREVVIDYLHRQFSSEFVQIYIEYFDEHLLRYHPEYMYQNEHETKKQTSYNEAKLKENCEEINNELELEQKVIVLIYLLDFINRGDQLTPNELKFVTTVSDALLIPKDDFREIRKFTFGEHDLIERKDKLLYIDANADFSHDQIKHFYNERLKGQIKVYQLSATNTMIFRYDGGTSLFLNGHLIKPNRTYIWSVGSVVKNSRVGAFYYSKMFSILSQASGKSRFVFEAMDIEYSFGGGPNGIKPFAFSEYSAQMIGIIGGSGCGKSTLLNVLNGNLKPKKGHIKINGYDIHENAEELRGVIGYVPQDDMLIKELTVYENLYFNARLSFKDYTKEQLREVVEEALVNFDLLEARDLSVGSPQRTILSGGQRKRLNIALELLREPSVLFVDEPTSGLSSSDSEKVMSLLKRQTFKGKLVITILHQPSSDIFKLIDKLMVMDQGGRVIYMGNPVEAITYFKQASRFADADESECKTCGNVNTEQILRIVESRVVDVFGKLTRKRKTSPEEWYKLYIDKIDGGIRKLHRTHDFKVPVSNFKVPSRWEQMRVYLKRDLLAKLTNSQYLLLNLSVAPLLAAILAFFTKHFVTQSNHKTLYVFSENPNIPAYLFMAVIVSLFLGLIVSAEEIFRDRKLLKRESFIHLSRFSYLNAKVAVMFIISAIQAYLFVVVGNTILEIEGMGFRYWLILFTASCWANLIGLNISSGFNSVVTIYILIPLILVPQLLFSGVVVDFNHMHKNIKSDKYVPVIGDVITSRWAYEALMVEQFVYNKYEKHFYQFEKKLNNSIFNRAYRIPEMRNLAKEVEYRLSNDIESPQNEIDLEILKNEILKLTDDLAITFNDIDKLQVHQYDTGVYSKLNSYLKSADKKSGHLYRYYVNRKEDKYNQLVERYGGTSEVHQFKQDYYNKQVASVVTSGQRFLEFIKGEDEFIRLKDQVYRDPRNPFGRAHYYAPNKMIYKWRILTMYYNLFVIWLFTGLFYAVLYYDLLSKLMDYFQRIRLNRLNKQFRKILSQVTQ
ncbi:MAG: ATP-binding cassette domain-containing protein [Bacteroidetes bacterium]|jgi:ABC-type multidrug transport system ATPase subunit|nr:ATP-binding cassette domain-containing protein [Bacteroidota bacterium]